MTSTGCENQESARKAYRLFGRSFQDKYPEAVKCLSQDEEGLFRFTEFPAAHWQHIRSTNGKRERVRHGAATDLQDQRLRDAGGHAEHGV
jgi:hypothetical protein